MDHACVRTLLAGCGLAPVDARVLLTHALGVSRTWLIAHDTDPLPPTDAARFEALAARRRAGEPVAYLVGEREFMGHVFQVTPDVLIPRPETELLVETALDCVRERRQPAVLDLGTGSGAVAVSIALARPDARVAATDVSPAALAVAAANAGKLGATVRFFQGDWYGALDGANAPAAFDAIVSNPPYIARGDAHLAQGDLRFEPPCALTDGADGLDALRAIVAGAAQRLLPDGWLWMEHGWDQAEAVRALLREARFNEVRSTRDLAGIERISGGYL